MRSRSFLHPFLVTICTFSLLLAWVTSAQAVTPPKTLPSYDTGHALNSGQLIIRPYDGSVDHTGPGAIFTLGSLRAYEFNAASNVTFDIDHPNGNPNLNKEIHAFLEQISVTERLLADTLYSYVHVGYAAYVRADSKSTIYAPQLLLDSRSPNFDLSAQPIFGSVEGYDLGLRVPILSIWNYIPELQGVSEDFKVFNDLRTINDILRKSANQVDRDLMSVSALGITNNTVSARQFFLLGIKRQNLLDALERAEGDLVQTFNASGFKSYNLQQAYKANPQGAGFDFRGFLKNYQKGLQTFLSKDNIDIDLDQALHSTDLEKYLKDKDPLWLTDIVYAFYQYANQKANELSQHLAKVASEYVDATQKPSLGFSLGYENIRTTRQNLPMFPLVVKSQAILSSGLSAMQLLPLARGGISPLVTAEYVQSHQTTQSTPFDTSAVRWGAGLIYQDKIASVETIRDEQPQVIKITRWNWQVGFEYRGRNAVDGPESYELFYRYRDPQTYDNFVVGVGVGANYKPFVALSVGRYLVPYPTVDIESVDFDSSHESITATVTLINVSPHSLKEVHITRAVLNQVLANPPPSIDQNELKPAENMQGKLSFPRNDHFHSGDHVCLRVSGTYKGGKFNLSWSGYIP